jgi:hypothetical protein
MKQRLVYSSVLGVLGGIAYGSRATSASCGSPGLAHSNVPNPGSCVISQVVLWQHNRLV